MTTTSRRGFIAGIIAAAAAPAIIRIPGILMPVRPVLAVPLVLTWHHIAVVREAGEMLVYLNGEALKPGQSLAEVRNSGPGYLNFELPAKLSQHIGAGHDYTFNGWAHPGVGDLTFAAAARLLIPEADPLGSAGALVTSVRVSRSSEGR